MARVDGPQNNDAVSVGGSRFQLSFQCEQGVGL